MTDNTISAFIEKLAKINPLQTKFVRGTLDILSDDEKSLLSEYISFYDTITNGECVKCYDFICKETFKEQLHFKKGGSNKYRLSSQEEANKLVYSNDEYMQNYMIGLSLSTFLWPNHLAISRYFKENLPRNKSGGEKYLEIGVGHGQNFSEAIKLSNYEKYIGYDLSAFSLSLTEKTVKFMNERANYELIFGDFMTADIDGEFDAVICGEVIEHVERPDELLKKIRGAASENALIYITTAVNSPAIDHIHLFSSTEEILDLFESCGLKLESKLVLPHAGTSVEESIKEKLPLNVAFVLRPYDMI